MIEKSLLQVYTDLHPRLSPKCTIRGNVLNLSVEDGPHGGWRDAGQHTHTRARRRTHTHALSRTLAHSSGPSVCRPSGPRGGAVPGSGGIEPGNDFLNGAPRLLGGPCSPFLIVCWESQQSLATCKTQLGEGRPLRLPTPRGNVHSA